jgi:hypothetical protein
MVSQFHWSNKLPQSDLLIFQLTVKRLQSLTNITVFLFMMSKHKPYYFKKQVSLLLLGTLK